MKENTMESGIDPIEAIATGPDLVLATALDRLADKADAYADAINEVQEAAAAAGYQTTVDAVSTLARYSPEGSARGIGSFARDRAQELRHQALRDAAKDAATLRKQY